MNSMVPLPIDTVLPELLRKLAGYPSVVLRAPTGAGKTTRVPPAIWDAGLSAGKQVVVLQPRRLAARATAARMARERQGRLGDEVGYAVRFEQQVSRHTRILVCTEGILLRRLQDDPFLNDVGVVVFDEFHERNLQSELALGMVRQVQTSVRPELKIVVMSATLAAEPIATYLGNAPLVASEGRLHPVEMRYLPVLERRKVAELAAEGVAEMLTRTGGDILCFLPGVGEIRQTHRQLQRLADEQGFVLHELYGDLPPDQQDAVLQSGARRKVILSTNVAETSVTIEGVTGVVDSGLARVLRFDPAVGIDRLVLEPISRASAEQRAGRAGRLQPGVCLRLWPEAAQRSRPEFDEPEVRRVDLAGTLLQLSSWIEPDVAAFPWFEMPREQVVAQGLALLERLGAIEGGSITEQGQAMAKLPVHPRIARLLLAAKEYGCLYEATLAAALLTEREPFERQENWRSRSSADHVARSDVVERVWTMTSFANDGVVATSCGVLQPLAAKNVLRVAQQLARLCGGAMAARGDDELLLRALLAAFPDRLARRRQPGSARGVMVGGKGVTVSPQSVLADDEEFFLCIDVDGAQGEAVVRQASAVEREWLAADLLRTVTEVEYDEGVDRLQARQRTYWDTLLLDDKTAALPGKEIVAAALAEAARERWERVFPPEDRDASDFVCRVRCLREWRPELELPTLDDGALQALLPLVGYGLRSLAELKRGPWLMHIKNLFTYQQLQTVEREAPERITVPSGNNIRLDYQPGKPPVLAVRIQEVFGLLETPRIAGGRVAVLMHLLAPNMRPQQVTDDLASFWKNTYAQVRKDLRARYPKHSWPEDPYGAVAVRRK